MINFCMCSAARSVGLALLAFTAGAVLGLICPLQILAIVELVILAVFGYLCMFKW